MFGLGSSYGCLMVSLLNAELDSFKSGIARWGVLIGEASYSLCLSHWFVLLILGRLALASGFVHHAEFGEAYRWVSIIFAVLFSVKYD